MRPTFLQFRHPKERTPDPYDPQITYNGGALGYTRTKSPTIGRGKRFFQYDIEAKKTGYMVGPGSYQNLNADKIKGGCPYKPLYGAKGDIKDCYYVGNILVLGSTEKVTRKTDSEWHKQDQPRPSSSLSKPSNSPIKNSSTKSVYAKNLKRSNNSTPKLKRIVFMD